MIKPKKLNRGDKVATISLSWDGTGEKYCWFNSRTTFG